MSRNSIEKLKEYSNKHNIKIDNNKKYIEKEISKKLIFYQNILNQNLLNYQNYNNYFLNNYEKNKTELLELLDLIKKEKENEMKYIAIYAN